jgi:thymidine kinase
VAKLYFYYSTMNAGKSTALLQAAYNYKERGMDVLLFTPAIDTRYESGHIYSRIGLSAEAIPFDADFNFYDYIFSQKTLNSKVKCVLIDESQFLTKEQVTQLTDVVDTLDLPVLAYGLRSDFQGEPFVGSLYLLIWADTIREIKTICHCGKKAIVNARIDENDLILRSGKQIQIGGNESYIALCRKHYKNSCVE